MSKRLSSHERPDRVVYLLKKFPRLSETFILNEILGLELLGVEVTVFSLRRPTDAVQHEALKTMKARVVYLPEHLSLQLPRYLFHFVRVFVDRPIRVTKAGWCAGATGSATAIKRFLQAVCLTDHLRDRSGVGVHCHFALSASSVAMFLKQLNGNPFTFTAHAKDIFLESIDRDLFRKKVDSAEGVITVSEFNRRHILESLSSGSDAKIERVYNGIDLSVFSPLEFERRDPSEILSVSRIVEKKGLDTLLESCALLKSRGVAFRLRIVGEGALKAALQDQAGSLQLKDEVEFPGALTQGEVLDAMRRCAVVAAPSRAGSDGNLDALPTVLLESLATETPVVSTTVSGIPEIIEDGKEGFLVPSNDPEALATRLERLLRDADLRRTMGSNGRWKAEQRFDRQNTVQETACFFRRRHGFGMHIGYVLTMFPRLSETFVLREILELEKQGARVTVFSQKRPVSPTMHSEFRNLKGDIVYLSPWWSVVGIGLLSHLRFALLSPWRYLQLLRFTLSRRNLPTIKKAWRSAIIAREVERRGIEHLHCHFMTGNARLTEFVTTLVPIPHSMTAHAKDIYASQLSDSKISRRLKEAAFVATISEYNRSHLLEKQPRARIELIPNALSPDQYPFTARDTRQGDDTLRVLGVGRLVKKKGFEILIETCRRLQSEGIPVSVKIVGDGEERATLERKIREWNLESIVELTGERTQEELRDLFQWSDVLAVPSVPVENGDIDGMPVVILEAMAQGVPVVASRLSGIPEVVVDGETGVLVNPGDVDGWVVSLRDARPPRLNDFAIEARRRLEEKYDIEKNAIRLLGLIRKAGNRKPS